MSHTGVFLVFSVLNIKYLAFRTSYACTIILGWLWFFIFYFKVLLWGLKIGIPAHFTLRAQSSGRGALSSGTHNKSSLKAQGCGRGRLYARHLAKRPNKRTDLAQEQHRGKGCQHLNVEPIAWQTRTRTMLSSSSPTTPTWGLIRQVTTPNKEKLTRI